MAERYYAQELHDMGIFMANNPKVQKLTKDLDLSFAGWVKYIQDNWEMLKALRDDSSTGRASR